MFDALFSVAVLALGLLCADWLFSFANNQYLHHLAGFLGEPGSLASAAQAEAGGLVLCALAFGFIGAAAAAALPRQLPRVRLVLLMGAAYSAFLYVLLPFLPAARYEQLPGWLLVLASFQYYAPAGGAAVGAWLATRHATSHPEGRDNAV
jgi:hypothetical protein